MKRSSYNLYPKQGPQIGYRFLLINKFMKISNYNFKKNTLSFTIQNIETQRISMHRKQTKLTPEVEVIETTVRF